MLKQNTLEYIRIVQKKIRALKRWCKSRNVHVLKSSSNRFWFTVLT